jgi:raffinose/stachyose/melibiose transport system permease protein
MRIKINKEMPYMFFILPALVVYSVLTIYPLIQTLGLSFTNWDGYSIKDIRFVGLTNFKRMFSDRSMRTALLNTIRFSLIQPFIVTVLAILLSLALNTGMKTRNLQRAIFFFPSVPSSIIIGYLWSYILAPTRSGLINNILGIAGIQPLLWLAKPDMAMISVIAVSVWGSVGWHACIYLARLQGISGDYYEAATIDGANAWQRFWSITFPMLASAMTISVMLLILSALKVYDLPFALTQGGPGTATTMVSHIIIKTGFVEKSYAKALAMSSVFFLFIAVVSAIQLTLMKKREANIDA